MFHKFYKESRHPASYERNMLEKAPFKSISNLFSIDASANCNKSNKAEHNNGNVQMQEMIISLPQHWL